MSEDVKLILLSSAFDTIELSVNYYFLNFLMLLELFEEDNYNKLFFF